MTNVAIKWTPTAKTATQYGQYALELWKFEERILSLKNGLSFRFKGCAQIDVALDTAAESTERCAEKLENLQKTLNEALNLYIKTEQSLVAEAQGQPQGEAELLYDPMFAAVSGGGARSGNPVLDAFELAGAGVSLWENFRDKISAATTYKADMENSSELAGASYSYDNGIFHSSGGYSVGSFQEGASFTSALFDEDGNFKPHVSADYNVSYALLEMDSSATFGNEMVGGAMAVSASVLTASASAQFNAGIDENGKFNASAKAGVEANLIEAEGSAEVNVMGVKGEVSGSVKVGLDAHADVGYSDGVLKWNVGFALGVGAEMGVSVDIGSAIDALQGCASSLWPKH